MICRLNLHIIELSWLILITIYRNKIPIDLTPTRKYKMQVANIKPVLKPEHIAKISVTDKTQLADKTKESSVDSQKKPNYTRMFEALNDCV